MRGWARVIVAAGLGVVGGGVVGAAGYEMPKNRTTKDVLPAQQIKGPDFMVADPVRADGYMYHFTVKSTYGQFNVSGLGALRKLEHEIWAIGQLQGVTRSDAFL